MDTYRTARRTRTGRRIVRQVVVRCAIAWIALFSLVPLAMAQIAQNDELIQKIDFEQRLDEQLPLDATFTDETGSEVRLQQYFGKRPVILALVYYECPMLCTEILNGLLQTTKELNFDAGTQYEIVAISIDPRESASLAAEKKDEYVRRYGREGTADGWHFLVGKPDQIKAVTEAVGYKFIFDPKTDQYAHPSGIVVLTPQGKVSHYFYGVQYNSRDVRLGLVEASENKIGSPVDKLLLYCFHYDPSSGQYNVVVMNFIRLFGAVTVAVMALGIGLLMFRGRSGKQTPQRQGESKG